MKLLLAFLCGVAICFCAYKVYGSGNVSVEHFGGRMNEHLDNVNRKASSLEHYDEVNDYEAENYENEFLETVEHFKKRNTPAAARQMAYNKLSQKHGPRFDAAIAKAQSKSNTGRVGSNPFYDAAAQFDIKVTRNTVNIPFALNVPLFGTMHYNAKYLSVMGNFMPNGVVFTSISVDALGRVVMVFTYTVTNVSDTLTVECTQVPYITFLSALNYNAMRLSKIRYAISDVTKITQFSQPFEVYSKTIFGKHGGNGISLASVNDPKSLNTGVRDIDNSIDVDNSTCIVVGIINEPNFSITLSSFVQQYNRISSNG